VFVSPDDLTACAGSGIGSSIQLVTVALFRMAIGGSQRRPHVKVRPTPIPARAVASGLLSRGQAALRDAPLLRRAGVRYTTADEGDRRLPDGYRS
jgi:hypothetical protein